MISIVRVSHYSEDLLVRLSFTYDFFQNSVRETYETLLTEIADLEKRHASIVEMRMNDPISACLSGNSSSSDRSFGVNSPGTEGVLLHLCTHLMLYIQARIQLIALYPFPI